MRHTLSSWFLFQQCVFFKRMSFSKVLYFFITRSTAAQVQVTSNVEQKKEGYKSSQDNQDLEDEEVTDAGQAAVGLARVRQLPEGHDEAKYDET